MSTAGVFTLEFPYRRSVGPVVGKFLTGLRDQRVLGVRTPSGRVIVPAIEYDPETGEPADDLVEVAQTGTVHEWTWVPDPADRHPLDRPFAWALVQLDGADSRFLHTLDAGSSDAISAGMRVRVRWREERKGHITDIECFEPTDD